MSLKIGIMTYYDAINPGAFLQAYALGQFLKEEFSVSVWYIDNRYVNIFEEQRNQLLKCRNPITLYKNSLRCRAMKTAQKQYLKIGDYDNQYDCVVIGSDEMWNVDNSMFSSYNVGEGVRSTVFISYAVSVGSFSGRLPDWVISAIKRFQEVSLRDYNSQDVISSSLNKCAPIHVDPVFLVDISAEKPKKNIGKYVLVYGLFSGNQAEGIQRFAHSIGCKTLSVDIMNAWCDSNLVAKSPFEFVGYIDKAHYVVTNMFHGTMLSIARSRSFVSVLTQRRRGKIEYAAELFGVKDRCVEGNLPNEEFFSALTEKYNGSVDFERINRIITEQREISRQYFENVFHTEMI